MKPRFLWVRAPWITLLERGTKTLEHRPRATHYRGPLVLCASQRAPEVETEPEAPPLELGVLGVTRCLVELIDCQPLTWDDLPQAYPAPWFSFDPADPVEPDGFGWRVRVVRKLPAVRLTGMLGTPDAAAVLAKNRGNRELARLIASL